MTDITPQIMVESYHPMPEEMRAQVEQLLRSPQVQQYLIQKAIQLLLENGVDLDNNGNTSSRMLKGLNRGVLLFLNELVAKASFEER